MRAGGGQQHHERPVDEGLHSCSPGGKGAEAERHRKGRLVGQRVLQGAARQIVDEIIEHHEGGEQGGKAKPIGLQAIKMADADAQHEHAAQHRGEGEDRPGFQRGNIGDEQFEDGRQGCDGEAAGKPAGGDAVAASGGDRQEKHAEKLRDEEVHRQQEARAIHWPPYARTDAVSCGNAPVRSDGC